MNPELHIVRAICKISSALTNFDQINDSDSKYFTGKLKRDFNKFFDFFNHHTFDMVSEMYLNAPDAWVGAAYENLDYLNTVVDADTEELKHLGILIAKVQSAGKDLKKIERTPVNRLFSEPLLNRLTPLVSRGYIKRLPVSAAGMEILLAEITNTINETVIE